MLRAGDRVGVWVIQKQLGSGGMGTVYLAHDEANAPVAVKELRAEGVPDAVKRFAREAKILEQLDHPGIIRFLGFHENPECLIMEFARGEPLDSWISRGPMSATIALGMTRQVAEALAYIHGKGVWHRDIKPQNILMEADGASKLVDFGVAVANDRTRYTQAGSLLGTLPYVPPEALSGVEPDPVRWDVYALGVVLFEALTGKLAFRGGDGSRTGFEARLIHEKMNVKHLDPGPLVPEKVRELVKAMTDADPNRRLSNPSEVSRRIQNLLDNAARASGPITVPVQKSNTMLYLLGGGAAVGVVGLLIAAVVAFVVFRPAPPAPPIETPVATAPPPVEAPQTPETPAPETPAPPPAETPPPAENPPATPPPTDPAAAPAPNPDAELESLRAEVKASQKRLAATLSPLKVKFVEQSGPKWDIVVDGTSDAWANASESVELTVSAVLAAIGTESASTHWKSRTLILKVDGKQMTTLPVSDARDFVKTGFSSEQRAAMHQAIRQ